MPLDGSAVQEAPAGTWRTCFHCASPVAGPLRWRAAVAGIDRDFCCAGCLAVAEAIDGAGLASFYASRSVPGAQRGSAAEADARGLAESAAAAGLLRRRPDGNHEATLLLDGLQCGACVWLIERLLAGRAGVVSADVNLATRRGFVVWRPEVASLAGILEAVASIGYRAYPYDAARHEAMARREKRGALARMAVALLAMMQVMMLALPAYQADDLAVEHRLLLEWASLVLTLPALLYSALPFFRGAWRDVLAGRLGMDVPIALGLGTAFAASVLATHAGSGAVYYDSVTMFIALVSVARYVEVVARYRAGLAIEEMARAMPEVGERMTRWPDEDATETVAASALAAGDVVLVRPGAAVPADGIVIQGRSSIEEALLTGESRPQARTAGDRVLAGSINRDGVLVVEVSAAGDATRLSTIQRMTERAAAARPRLARAVDNAASWFVWALLALVAVTVAVWWQVDPQRVVAIAFAMLAVSCPCAMSLATPAAIAAATGALSRRRIVLAQPDALETLARVTQVVLDKTGTLTEGRYRVLRIATAPRLSQDRALAVAAGLEARSEHPIAEAIRARCDWAAVARDVEVVAGQGVEGSVGGVRWRIGRRPYVAALARSAESDEGVPAAGDVPEIGTGPDCEIALGDEDGIAATFVCADALRADAAQAIARIRAAGLTPIVLSGDRASTVGAVARALGIADARGDCTPANKREVVAALQREGAVVAMVGDGVNDAPALRQAHVSVSLARATPLAQWSSDVIVPGDALMPLAEACEHARRMRAVIRENLVWATLYNVVAIPAAAIGWVTPLWATLGMSVSSLVVVGNAMRLARVAQPESMHARAAAIAAEGAGSRAA